RTSLRCHRHDPLQPTAISRGPSDHAAYTKFLTAPAIEVGLSLADAHDAYRAFTGDCSGFLRKVIAGGGFAAGVLLPGGGYGRLGKTLDNAPRTAAGAADAASGARLAE